MDLQQLLEPVIAGDNPAVQLIEVGGRKPSAVQLHHRPDLRRQDGQDAQHHPLQLVLGHAEGLDDLQPLDDTGLFLPGRTGKLLLEAGSKLLDVDARQQLAHRLGAHADAELLAVHLAVFGILLFGQHQTGLQRRVAGVKHDVLGKVQHLFQLLGGDVQHQCHPGGDRLEVPDMRHRACQLDVSHALAAHLLGGHIHAALLALDDLFAVGILIFAAHAGAVLGRAKDALAEQTADLRLQRAVVDGLGLRHLAV